ncbi:MAG TPA: hypothetical protein VMF06_20840, partial [Candidatus Limnocylindria bacterium]|nr:hypothetical protein [Candidatus Limnocylindria bacterium]
MLSSIDLLRLAWGLSRRFGILIAVLVVVFGNVIAIGGELPEIVDPPVGGIFPFGSKVTLGVQVEGDAPFTYRWRLNGSDIPVTPRVIPGGGLPAAAPVSSTYASPYGLAVDQGGSLYLAENSFSGNGMVSVVRRLDTNGVLSIAAGDNVFGFSGDGGPATNARLYNPYAIAFDKNGALYIADASNNRIRKVSINGVIETLGGNGRAEYSGDEGWAVEA